MGVTAVQLVRGKLQGAMEEGAGMMPALHAKDARIMPEGAGEKLMSHARRPHGTMAQEGLRS